MTSRNVVLGFILPIVLMSFCLLEFLFLDGDFFIFSFAHLLVIFAYICILSFLSKKKNFISDFEDAYLVISIPFIIGFLYAIMSKLGVSFLDGSMFFDNLAFYLFIGGFVAVSDVGGTVRLFYNPDNINDALDILFVFIITAILLITPQLIRKFTKSPKTNIQENSYGS